MDTRAARITANITFLKQGHKPKDEEKGSEENKQFDPGGKGEKAPFSNAAVISIFFSFWGELWAMRGPLLVLRVVFACVCPSTLFYNYSFFQVTPFQRAEKYEGRRGSSR